MKGNSVISPNLRGIAVGPMFSRLYDIIVNFRMENWYHPNPEQAGCRKKTGMPPSNLWLIYHARYGQILWENCFHWSSIL